MAWRGLTHKFRLYAADVFELGGDRLIDLDRKISAEGSGSNKLARFESGTVTQLVSKDDDRKERIDEGVPSNSVNYSGFFGTHRDAHSCEIYILPIFDRLTDDERPVGDVIGIGLD